LTPSSSNVTSKLTALLLPNSHHLPRTSDLKALEHYPIFTLHDYADDDDDDDDDE